MTSSLVRVVQRALFPSSVAGRARVRGVTRTCVAVTLGLSLLGAGAAQAQPIGVLTANTPFYSNHDGRCLDSDVSSPTHNGTKVQIWNCNGWNNQKWTFASTGDGYYEIKGVGSGKLMEVAGLSRDDGGNVAIYADSDVPQQHWAVTPTGDGYYFLINRYSGLCLGVDEGSTADGANIEQQPYASLTRQQWQIIPS